MIRVRCRHCGSRFKLHAKDVGKKGYCPNKDCRQPFRAPSANSDLPKKPKRKSSRQTSRSKRKRKNNQRGINYPVWGASTLGILIISGILIGWLRSGDEPIAVQNSVVAAEAVASPPQVSRMDFNKEVKPFFKTYCIDCHSADSQEGDFSFDKYANVEAIKSDREIWGKVLNHLRLSAMPPSDADHPTESDREKIVEWIDHQLFYVDCSIPHDPGRVTARRLNRTEYNNTVRDLLDVDFQPANDFPSDDVGYGFDNIGDVLSVPPLLIEKYLTAAEQVAAKAIPVQHPGFFNKRALGKELKEEGAAAGRGNGIKVMTSRGRVLHKFDFPTGGTYRVKIEAMADQAGDELAKMQVNLDDKKLKTIDIKDHKKKNEIAFEFESTAGKHNVSAAFLNDFYDQKAKGRKDRNLYVAFIEVEGPLGLPKSAQTDYALLRVIPDRNNSVAQAAQKNLREFLPRAFRRPVNEEEILKYAGLVEMASERGATFPKSMQIGLQAILVSPHFLFRMEDGRQIVGTTERLNDFALASRLSYFLWSSLPDEQLFDLANENRLHEPGILKAQVQRMLSDPKTNALVENFSGQWLGLRKLSTNDVSPDTTIFPEFDDKLRSDMWKETELFFGSVVLENRSIYDLLDGRYSFLNARLAKLYGIEGINGEEFQRVEFKDDRRMGILTHGSVLTLTSYPNRTSPVKRGQWVLENLLNDAPPDPPPTAPALEETQKTNPNLSFRKQLEIHREDPGCHSCHVIMDEIGFGLENFDAIGRWRTKDGNFDIDSSGTMPSGESFSGPKEMIAVLRNRQGQFGRCLTEKLMTYALGRGLEYYDRCAIDDVMAQLEQDDRFMTLVLGIVESAPFQMRRNHE